MSTPSGPLAGTLSVIVPAFGRRPPTLERVTAAIEAQLGPGDELIVADGAPLPGPAAARNAGAARARNEVLVFVDADVVPAADALDRIRERMAAAGGPDALLGSYDARPPAPGVVSAFRNLLHHHVHHAAAGPVASFWAGLGAVRREVFARAGGFDHRRYPEPSIEDIELGVRLTAAGARIELDPAVRGTHLKRWTFRDMVRTDFTARGVPWVTLIVADSAPATGLNLGWRHRLSALASVGGAAALLARRPAGVVAALGALVALNRDLYALVARVRGPGAGLAAPVLHAVHHLTGVAAVPVGLVAAGRLRAGRERRGASRTEPERAGAS